MEDTTQHVHMHIHENSTLISSWALLYLQTNSVKKALTFAPCSHPHSTGYNNTEVFSAFQFQMVILR